MTEVPGRQGGELASFSQDWTVARVVIAVVVCLGLAAYIQISWHWPLVYDMQVIHYVSFLIDKGWSPYRQIGDMNMPGAYLFEQWALHMFGNTDLGWRFYDFSLCALLIVAGGVIARRVDWLAGAVGASLFVLLHASEGPFNAGQRDEVMAVALVVGYAFCFEAVRRRMAWLMFFFGLAVAMAAAVKPTLVIVGPALLVVVCLELRRRGVRLWSYILWTLVGFAAAAAILVHFLVAHQSTQAFYFDLTRVIPHYMTLAKHTWGYMMVRPLQKYFFAYISLAFAIAVLRRGKLHWEDTALLLGILFGLVNYFGQGKGYPQHRYTTEVFLALWATPLVFAALRERGPVRAIGWVAAAYLVLFFVPDMVVRTHEWPAYDNFSAYLERDLRQVGTGRLQNNVQCLDIVDGCLTALFHLQIVQATGSTGDLLLFQPKPAPVVDWARGKFWKVMQGNPPPVLVMSNWWYGGLRDFNKVDAWPEFADYLHKNYVLTGQRNFFLDDKVTSDSGSNPDTPAYRIYILRGSPLLDPQLKH